MGDKLEDNMLLITCQGNKMYVDKRDQVIVPQLVNDGVHEKYQTELFRELVKPGMIVVDIGAYNGYYTLIAAELLEGRGWVYAFEPEPNNFQLLVKNIQINDYTNITAVRRALSNKNGKIRLFIDRINLGSPSLAEENVEESVGFVEVETVTLDGFFRDVVKDTRIDLLKMDAQGAEGLIVEGARKILKETNPKIIMEFWPYGLRNLTADPSRLLDELQSYGFKVKVIDSLNERLEQAEVMKIYEMCEATKNRKGFVNLLLEK